MNKLSSVVVATVAAISLNVASAQTLEECRESQKVFSGLSCEGLKPAVKNLTPYEECKENQLIFSGLTCEGLSRYKPSDCAVFSTEEGTLTINDVTIKHGGTFIDWEEVVLKIGEGGRVSIESYTEVE